MPHKIRRKVSKKTWKGSDGVRFPWKSSATSNAKERFNWIRTSCYMGVNSSTTWQRKELMSLSYIHFSFSVSLRYTWILFYFSFLLWWIPHSHLWPITVSIIDTSSFTTLITDTSSLIINTPFFTTLILSLHQILLLPLSSINLPYRLDKE